MIAPIDSRRKSDLTTNLLLFFGLLLLFLSIWKGEGGYLDLHQYLDNAENLWLKGDLSLPSEGNGPRHYYIHPLGSAVAAGPFVLAGAVLDRNSNGYFRQRDVAAFCIPVYGALACVLIFCIGRQLGLTARVSLWGALMLGLGCSFMYYTRLFFTEVPMVLSLCVALWAFLIARESGSLAWALAAGAGLAGITACHFNAILISGALWLGMAWAFFRAKELGPRAVAALCLIPTLVAGALLYMNKVRFGHPFSTGYEQLLAELDRPFSLGNVPKNIPNFLFWVAHNLWIVPALWGLGKLWRAQRALAFGIVLATVAHLAFMQTYLSLKNFPLRHPLPVVAMLSIGLLYFGDELHRRWPERGLIYSGILFFVLNFLLFLRGDDGTQTFLISPQDGRLSCYTWYMVPSAKDSFGTPMGALQIAAFLSLAAAGAVLLAYAVFAAGRLDDNSTQRQASAILH